MALQRGLSRAWAAVGLCLCLLVVIATADDPISLHDIEPRCGRDSLPPGATDCAIDDLMIAGRNRTYTLVMGRGIVGYGLLVTLRMTMGVSDMSLQTSDGSVLRSRWMRTPDTNAYNELFVRIPASQIAAGTYTITIQALKNQFPVSPFWLRVEMFDGDAKLAPKDADALRGIMNKCCSPPFRYPNLCRVILPNALGPAPSLELCQTGNFICNSAGRLLKASFGFASFSCPLPVKELSALDALQTLVLDYNDFQSSSMSLLASAVSTMPGLTTLFARNSSLVGSLPCALPADHPLETLYVGYNQLTGSVPACYMGSTTLRELSAMRTQLAGTLPDVVPAGSNLRVLRFPNTCPAPNGAFGEVPCGAGLSGTIPASLGNARNLQVLDLAWQTSLTGLLPNLPDGLQELDLAFAGLTGNLPGTLPSSMVLMDITNNSFTGGVPDMRDCKDLWGFVAPNNKLDGPLPASFGTAASTLVQLNLANNKFRGNLLATAWGDLIKLEAMTLRGNQLTGILPSNLATLPKLQYLNLRGNMLSGSLDTFASAIPSPAGIGEPSKSTAAVAATSGGNGRKLLQGIWSENAQGVTNLQANQQTTPNTGTSDNSSQQGQPAQQGPSSRPSLLFPRAVSAQRGEAAPNGQVFETNAPAAELIPVFPNSLTSLVLSDNQFTGTLPAAFESMAMFYNVSALLSPQSTAFILANNQLEGEYPVWLLMEQAGCRLNPPCSLEVDMSGNQLYCPTAKSLKATGVDFSNKNITDALGSLTCLSGNSSEPIMISTYLSSPAGYAAQDPPRRSRGSNNAGKIAGIVIGSVLGGLLLIGAVVGAAMLYRSKQGSRGPFRYQKNSIPNQAISDQIILEAAAVRLANSGPPSAPLSKGGPKGGSGVNKPAPPSVLAAAAASVQGANGQPARAPNSYTPSTSAARQAPAAGGVQAAVAAANAQAALAANIRAVDGAVPPK